MMKVRTKTPVEARYSRYNALYPVQFWDNQIGQVIKKEGSIWTVEFKGEVYGAPGFVSDDWVVTVAFKDVEVVGDGY